MNQVSDVLRDKMHEASGRGVSLYRMAKECDLDDSIVYRFYHGECGLALSSVDLLCDFLGLELAEGSAVGRAFEESYPTRGRARKRAPGARKTSRRKTKKAAKKKSAKKKTARKAARKKTAKKAAKKKTPKKKTAKKAARKKTAKKRRQ